MELAQDETMTKLKPRLLESLLSESQTSDLTLAQNEPPAFTLIFFIILFVNMRQPRTIYHLAMLALRLFFNLQPKVIDWADVVGEAGASV